MNKKNNLLPEYVWIIFVGILLTVLVLMHVVPGHAAELSSQISAYENVLVSAYDEGILIGSPRFYVSGGKIFDPTGNASGSKLVSYPMSAGNYSNWTGSYSSYGFDVPYFEVVQGDIFNFSSTREILFVNEYHTIGSAPIKSMNLEDDVWEALYYESYVGSTDYYCFVCYKQAASGATIDNDIIQANQEFDLYRWNQYSQTWGKVAASATQSDLDSAPVTKIIGHGGPSGSVIITPESYLRVQCKKFSLDTADQPDEPDDPTPTPIPSGGLQFIFNYEGSYYAVEISGSGLLSQQQVNLTTVVSHALSDYGSSTRTWLYPVFQLRQFDGSNYQHSTFSLTFTADSVSSCVVYSLGQYLVSSDFDYIKGNYSGTSITKSSSYPGTRVQMGNYFASFFAGVSQPSTFFQFCFMRNTSGYSTAKPTLAYHNLNNAVVLESLTSNTSGSWLYYATLYDNDSVSASAYPALVSGLGLVEYTPTSTPEPTPDPNATPTPTPSPTPTEPPHVIINWPTSTPEPTPPGQFDPFVPPDGVIPPLNSDTFDNVASDLPDHIPSSAAFGFIGFLFSLIPADAMWWFWFFIFIVLVIAIAKLFIHSSGG